MPIQLFSAASSDLSTFMRLSGPGEFKDRVGKTFCRIAVTSPGETGTATLQLARVIGGVVVERINAVYTVGAKRTNLAGNGGDYILEITTEWPSGTTIADVGDGGSKTSEWYLGVVAFGTITSCTVYADPM